MLLSQTDPLSNGLSVKRTLCQTDSSLKLTLLLQSASVTLLLLQITSQTPLLPQATSKTLLLLQSASATLLLLQTYHSRTLQA
jgi:hypothetical protein